MTRRLQMVRFIRVLLATNLKATLMLRGAFAMQVVFMILNNLAFFVFWWVLMQRVPDLRGWHLQDIELLFGVTAAGFGLAVTLAGGVRHLGRFIDQGELDTLLTQPKPVLVQALGMRSQASGIGDFISGVVYIAWSGHLSWRELPVAALAILVSAAVFIGCGIVFFSLAFWLGRTETLARQLWELVIMFSLYPEPLFGGALRLVLFTVLPAGFVGYVPVRFVHDPSIGLAVLLVCSAVAYLMFAAAVFEAGLKRYTSGSRFGTFG